MNKKRNLGMTHRQNAEEQLGSYHGTTRAGKEVLSSTEEAMNSPPSRAPNLPASAEGKVVLTESNDSKLAGSEGDAKTGYDRTPVPNMPESQIPEAEGDHAVPTDLILVGQAVGVTGNKRKAGAYTKDLQAIAKKKRQLITGPSDKQEKEMRYAKKQVEAYRAGKGSSREKRIRNLVFEKAQDLVEEERKKRMKAAESSMPLLIDNGEHADRYDEDADNKTIDNKTTEEDALAIMAEPIDEDEKVSEQKDGTPLKKQGKLAKLIKTKSYEQELQKLCKDRPTSEQVAKLSLAATSGPQFLGRTASLVRGVKFGRYHNKTNGFTSPHVLLPAADSRDAHYRSHERLTDMSQGEIKYMAGNHLIWKDLLADEFLSYSKDPLFLVVHALRRHHEEQSDVTIQFIDRRKAKTADGELANFYSALDIYTIFDVPKWSGWGDNAKVQLHPRKFTQEYLSHGPVLNPDSDFAQARIEDLIEDGLYEIFPEFETPGNFERAGLYTLQVVYRKAGYPPAGLDDADEQQSQNRDAAKSPEASNDILSSDVDEAFLQMWIQSKAIMAGCRAPRKKTKKLGPIYSYDYCSREVPITVELLGIVRKVTMNFRHIPENVDRATPEPPLHVFICFLTFEKRKKQDHIFMDWIRNHYNAQDVLELYTDARGHPLHGFTIVADNLPGYMQYLDLVRDCITIFSLACLPPNEVQTQHEFSGYWDRSFAYAAYDHIHHRRDIKSKEFDITKRLLLGTKGKKLRGKKKQLFVESGAGTETQGLLQTSAGPQEVTTSEHRADARMIGIGEIEPVHDAEEE